MKNVIRSVLSVFAGSLTYFLTVLAATYLLRLTLPQYLGSTPILIVTIVYSVILSGLGGYVTAWLSPTAPMKHVMALTILLLLGGLASSLQLEGIMPRWFQIAVVALPIPVILLGGSLRKSNKQPA